MQVLDLSDIPENFPINVKIIADSVNKNFKQYRVTTFELEYPRSIHAELLTHRTASKNSQSSRAVPVATTLKVNRENPIYPVIWGKNKSGMSAVEELQESDLFAARDIWFEAAENAFKASEALHNIGLHKQWANRITEPFSTIKVVFTVTSPDLDGILWLRDDIEAAQPEIVILARKIKEEYAKSVPRELPPGFWHVPYVAWHDKYGFQYFYDENGNQLTAEEACKISASCCAQVSYRKLDDTKEKAIEIYNKLFRGAKPHLSPTEHQAKAMFKPIAQADVDFSPRNWERGVTALTSKYDYKSGNFNGWIQYRQLI